MKNSSILIFLLVAAVFSATVEAQKSSGGESYKMQKIQANQDLREQVKSAFEAAEKGDFQPAVELKALGEPILPYLEPYLDDADWHVRKRVLWYIRDIVSKDSIPLFAKAISDSNKNVSADAAQILYEFYAPSFFEDDEKISESLRQAVKKGNDSTAALLLLSYFPGAETEKSLEAVTKKNKDERNLGFMNFPMVEASLPANVSLSHLGNAKANTALLGKIKKGEENDLEFLLRAVGFIDNREVLTKLFQKTINDTRTIQPVTDGKQPRKGTLTQMRDLAVNMFAEKLNLEFDFEIETNKRYTKTEITEAKQKISAALAEI